MTTCANCKFYGPFNGEGRGECYLNPPTVFSTGGRGRPAIRPGDRACSHHQEGEPQVKEKRGGDTVGAAIKAGRKDKDKPKPAIQSWQGDKGWVGLSTDAVGVSGCKVTVPGKMP